MDVYVHSVLALSCIILAYFCGAWPINYKIEKVITSMISTLEEEGFLVTSIDKDGDKELILISELIEKAVKDLKMHP